MITKPNPKFNLLLNHSPGHYVASNHPPNPVQICSSREKLLNKIGIVLCMGKLFLFLYSVFHNCSTTLQEVIQEVTSRKKCYYNIGPNNCFKTFKEEMPTSVKLKWWQHGKLCQINSAKCYRYQHQYWFQINCSHYWVSSVLLLHLLLICTKTELWHTAVVRSKSCYLNMRFTKWINGSLPPNTLISINTWWIQWWWQLWQWQIT